MRRFFFLLTTLALFAGCGGDEPKPAAVQPLACPTETASVVNATVESDRFIVKVSEKARNSKMLTGRFLSAVAAKSNERISDDSYLLKYESLRNGKDIARLMNREDFDYIEPDLKVSAAFLSDDENLAKQWAHDKVHSAAAWDITRGSSSVIVAVLDSGVDYTHPDLAANIWINQGEIAGNGIDDDHNGFVDDVYGWNFVSNNNNPMADDAPSFHGTHVAGTVGAVGDNGRGISGHAQVVKIMPIKFLGSNGSGYTSDAVKGIDYAIKNHAQIINNSWGSGTYSQSLSDAISRARAAGILFVAAAGNSAANNDTSNFYPANYSQDNVISVAATDSGDALASFSNYGGGRVHIASPGVNIYSTLNGNSYGTKSGTSMATPLISGVLAMMRGLRSDLSYLQLKDVLITTADPVAGLVGKVMADGRVNAYRALAATLTLPEDMDPLPHANPGCP
jgi:subtilisin family serine protease